MPKCKKIIFQPGSQLKTINNAAFAGMFANQIVIPSSVKSIASYLFAYNNIKNIDIYLCAKNDFSLSLDPFKEGQTGIIYVTRDYQGETFGGFPVERMSNESVCLPYIDSFEMIGPSCKYLRNSVLNCNILVFISIII